MTWWRRLYGWWLARRTHAVIAERECRHDGTRPWCEQCVRDAAGGW